MIDIVLLGAFALGLPWTVLGFWNAVIGLWLLHWAPAPMEQVAPYAAAGNGDTAIAIKTAILMTLRNEDPARAFLRLRTVKASVDATGFGERYSYFILSDTNDEAVGKAEAEMAANWQRDVGRGRRRPHRLPPAHRQHRLQGRQRARFLRTAGATTSRSCCRWTRTV